MKTFLVLGSLLTASLFFVADAEAGRRWRRCGRYETVVSSTVVTPSDGKTAFAPGRSTYSSTYAPNASAPVSSSTAVYDRSYYVAPRMTRSFEGRGASITDQMEAGRRRSKGF